MLDKSYTIRTINEVLKEAIIPNIDNSMAKEQAIALVSVLKNLDMQTKQNLEPKEQLSSEIKQTLNEYIEKMKRDSRYFNSHHIIEQLSAEINETVLIEDVSAKWKRLNEIQCKLLRLLYKESNTSLEIEQLYILPFRHHLRQQLNIEMSLVR